MGIHGNGWDLFTWDLKIWLEELQNTLLVVHKLKKKSKQNLLYSLYNRHRHCEYNYIKSKKRYKEKATLHLPWAAIPGMDR